MNGSTGSRARTGGICAGVILDEIEKSFPRELAMEWDNPGLQLGRRSKEVKKIMLALDATRRVVSKAAEENVDLLITHHPMIFGSVKQINEETALGRKLLDLAEHGICYYAMHTNYDIALQGMAKAAAARLGLAAEEPLELTGTQEDKPVGIGFVSGLEESCTAAELAARCKKAFGLPAVLYYDGGHPIHRIAVCPGSGRHMLEAVRAAGADAMITGDSGHHDGMDYYDEELSLIDAGHFCIEQIFTEEMEAFLTARFPGLTIMKEETDERRYV